MHVRWNEFETVPVALNEADDLIVELASNGNNLTVKRTQFGSGGELAVIVNGSPGKSGKTPETLVIDKYAIRVFSYENDNIVPKEVPILSHEVNGKTLRLQVDIWNSQ